MAYVLCCTICGHTSYVINIIIKNEPIFKDLLFFEVYAFIILTSTLVKDLLVHCKGCIIILTAVVFCQLDYKQDAHW